MNVGDRLILFTWCMGSPGSKEPKERANPGRGAVKHKLGALVLVAALAFGCGAGPGGSSEPKSRVILKVNEAEITVADFQKELDRLPPHLKSLASTKEGQKQFLEEMVKRELLLQEAERRKIGERPEIVEKAKDFRRRLLLEALLEEEIGAKVMVDEKEAEGYYKAHPEEFRADRVRAKHILVGSEEEAKKVLERLKKEKFEDLARELSLDKASGQKGGDLDYFGRGQMVPEFEKAAFALKVGETSGIVKSPFGYHIIRLVDRKAAPPPTFEEVKEPLKRRLLSEKQRKRFEEWLTSLQAGAKVKIEENLLPVGEEQRGKTEAPKAPEAPKALPKAEKK